MDYKKIYKRVETRYIIAGILLVLLFISRQIIVQRQIDLGKDMSTSINISGRQRMLSQKIAKDALMIYEDSNNDSTKIYLEDLELSLNTFEKSHYNLINGNEEEGIVVDNCNTVIELFNEADPYFKNILGSGHKILEIAKQENYNKEQILDNIKIITSNERIFLEKMDEIVFHYDDEAQDNILQIKRLERIVFYITIFAILFITMFIFIPATKTLRYAFVDISEKNENIIKIFNSMKGALFLVNKNGSIINNNPAALDIIIIDESQMKNTNIETAVKWIDVNIKNVIKDVISGREFDGVEVKIEDKNDKTLTFLVSATKGTYRKKEIVLISAYDITLQKKVEDVLKNLAIKDELTELYNRHFLESIIGSEIEKSKQYDYPISAAMLDIDNFKRINDKWGHPVGDIVLKEISKILRENSRECDYQIRVGGEEFVVLMPYTNLEGAYILAEKLRKAIENNINPIVGTYTASFGVGERKMDETYFELYNRIDNALYKAKSSGKNCVVKSILDNKAKVGDSLEWKESWNSGEKTIDAQHRELLSIIGKITDSVFNSGDKGSLIYDLDVLMNHIEEHFLYEEKVLADVEYTNLSEHKKIHASLVEKSHKLKGQALNGEINLQDLLEFMLHDVIIGHLLKEDTKFFSFIHKES